MTKRELILDAAAVLFAEHSYEAVGIRDIARQANVNSAMISYYFGSKQGLLQEIFSQFTEQLLNISGDLLLRVDTYYELCDLMGPALLSAARQNPSTFLVGLRSLNRDIEWLKEAQQRFKDKTEEHFNSFLKNAGLKEKKPIRGEIILGAVMGMVYSDYLLGGGENINNDELLDEYADTVIQVLKSGLPSLVE